MTLDFDKIVTFTASWYKQIGTFVIKWIREDTKQGIMQNGNAGMQYSNTVIEKWGMSYKQLKSQDMRINGKRIPEYKGKRISSNNVSYVDLTLTGDMLRGLHVKESAPNKVTISFRPQDYDKVVGNAIYGRVITGLRKQNREKLTKLVVERINQNIKNQLNSKKWNTEIKT